MPIKGVIAYQCYDHGRFHIGHADKTQIAVREKSLATINTHCPGCSEPVSVERRWDSIESRNLTVYCSSASQEEISAEQGTRDLVPFSTVRR
jgi:hypothetical protein